METGVRIHWSLFVSHQRRIAEVQSPTQRTVTGKHYAVKLKGHLARRGGKNFQVAGAHVLPVLQHGLLHFLKMGDG